MTTICHMADANPLVVSVLLALLAAATAPERAEPGDLPDRRFQILVAKDGRCLRAGAGERGPRLVLGRCDPRDRRQLWRGGGGRLQNVGLAERGASYLGMGRNDTVVWVSRSSPAGKGWRWDVHSGTLRLQGRSLWITDGDRPRFAPPRRRGSRVELREVS